MWKYKVLLNVFFFVFILSAMTLNATNEALGYSLAVFFVSGAGTLYSASRLGWLDESEDTLG